MPSSSSAICTLWPLGVGQVQTSSIAHSPAAFHRRHCDRSEAISAGSLHPGRDCFVAALLAMTIRRVDANPFRYIASISWSRGLSISAVQIILRGDPETGNDLSDQYRGSEGE